ncbi:23376_t:CDS:2, partial [Dentiscutata erythropus]
TEYLSSSLYPTISDICLTIGGLIRHFDQFIDKLQLEEEEEYLKKKTAAITNLRQEMVHSKLLALEEQETEQLPPEEELDLYLALSICKTNSLSWWEQNEYRFPTLATMAHNYLAIQGTSVPCEEAFSVAARTITKVRSCLLPETAQALLCLKSWMEQD